VGDRAAVFIDRDGTLTEEVGYVNHPSRLRLLPRSAEAIRRLNAAGMTIVYTSHYMEEVEELCERIAVLSHGRLVAIGTPNELKTRIGPHATLDDVFAALAGPAVLGLGLVPLLRRWVPPRPLITVVSAAVLAWAVVVFEVVKEALADRGVEFVKVAMQPGGPQGVGRLVFPRAGGVLPHAGGQPGTGVVVSSRQRPA